MRVKTTPAAGIVPRLRAVLPAPATVTLTSLPHHPPEETVDLAVGLADAGYRAVPQLALMEDTAQLSGGAMEMGTAVYPEGLPGTPDEDLTGLLLAKAPLAS